MEITVEIPDPLTGQSSEELARRARLLLVIDEVRAGRLTRAAAVRALDMMRDDFLIEAGQHGLYAIDYDLKDFKQSSAPCQRVGAEHVVPCWSWPTVRR